MDVVTDSFLELHGILWSHTVVGYVVSKFPSQCVGSSTVVYLEVPEFTNILSPQPWLVVALVIFRSIHIDVEQVWEVLISESDEMFSIVVCLPVVTLLGL